MLEDLRSIRVEEGDFIEALADLVVGLEGIGVLGAEEYTDE